MLPRAEVERVLQQHSRSEFGFPGHPTPKVCEILPGLINDLCALAPSPSREALERIFESEGVIPVTHPSGCLPQRLIEKIMAWATGEKGQKVWCEHIYYGTHFVPDDGFTSWVLRSQHPKVFSRALTVEDMFCPICATPRPG